MDPLTERAAPGLHLETEAETRARWGREEQERQAATRAATQLQVRRSRLQQVEVYRLPPTEQLLRALTAERDEAVAALAQMDAQDQDTGRLHGTARRAVERVRDDLRERIEQIDNGSSSMAPGDLRARLRRRGVELDHRSLPFVQRQVADLIEERDRLRREIEDSTAG